MNEAPALQAWGLWINSRLRAERRSGSRRGACAFDFHARLGRLREAKAQRAELGELFLRQLVITILEIRHRFRKPLFLVLWSRLGNSTADHLLEHLISCLFERSRYAYFLSSISNVGRHASCCVWKSYKYTRLHASIPLEELTSASRGPPFRHRSRRSLNELIDELSQRLG